jgi:peptidoglycan/xylan/chitin deacetylase (PgdA/CDA1 family)
MIAILIVTVVLILPLAVGIVALTLCGKHPTGTSPTGLLFHTITFREYSHFSHVTPDKFSAIIGELVRQKVAAETLKDAVRKSPLQSLVITFDDGFHNFYSHAFPVLETCSVKVTVFPIAGFIGRPSDWDILPRQEHLSKSNIREIAEHGHEIGSHTMTHADLTKLNTSDLNRELRESKLALEDITGQPVTSLSFPFGFWNRRVWETAQELGYTQATVCRFYGRLEKGLVPVLGVYSYDTMQDVFAKVFPRPSNSHSIARCTIMSHFAKGTPLWKFRENYHLFP